MSSQVQNLFFRFFFKTAMPLTVFITLPVPHSRKISLPAEKKTSTGFFKNFFHFLSAHQKISAKRPRGFIQVPK